MEKCYEEMIALRANETWELTSYNQENKLLVVDEFSVKFIPNGQIERLKAQLIGKSYTDLWCWLFWDFLQ